MISKDPFIIFIMTNLHSKRIMHKLICNFLGGPEGKDNEHIGKDLGKLWEKGSKWQKIVDGI